MKFVVEFELDKKEIKADYRRIFISFFKKSISDYMDGNFYEELYDSGANKKALVWSVGFYRPKFEFGMIRPESNKVLLTLKIQDMQTALIYYFAILGMKNEKFMVSSDNFMVLKSIKMVKEQEIGEETADFKILSPICLREHKRDENKDWYYAYGDEEFEYFLRESLKDELLNHMEIDQLEFDFTQLKKVVVPAFKLKIPATIGVLQVKGNPVILNCILKAGLGSRRNAGFGLVENL